MPSTSRAEGVAATPAAVRTSPNKWQFVNVNEPKKNQDKHVISLVRAHAMRSVRRNQRIQLTAQHQKAIKAIAPQSPRAESGVTIERSIQMKSDDWCVGDKGLSDWLEALSGMFSMFDFITLGRLASSDGAEHVPECDRDADEAEASKRSKLGTHRTGGPKSLVGDGVFDPFNAMPVAGCANYYSNVLNHCRYLHRNTFLFGQRCIGARTSWYLLTDHFRAKLLRLWVLIVYPSTSVRVRFLSLRHGFPTLYKTQHYFLLPSPSRRYI